MMRWAAAAVLAVAVIAPSAVAGQAPSPTGLSPQDLSRLTASGSYLAARHAGIERDAQAAATFYRAALRHDPKNGELLERAFLTALADGEMDEAVRLADRIVQIDKTHKVARLVLGVRALKQKQYQAARQSLAQSTRGPIADLTATVLTAWALAGSNETRTAVDTIDRLNGPEWYAAFKDLHAGLILDQAGNRKDAGKRLERAHTLDANQIRVVQAYGSWLSRNQGKDDALNVFGAYDKALPRNPLILEAIDRLTAGQKLPPLAESPQAGAAELLYGLGSALGRQGGEDLALVYLQLAIYLDPEQPLALLTLADLYETLKKPALALKLYQKVPERSPLRRNAEIQMAIDLDTLDRTDEAKKHLEKLIAEKPGDLEAVRALGDILRGRKDFAECANVYTKGISTIVNPEKQNWVIFYFRGICYERSKQWPLAEADLKKALDLYPDQPHVLNYLGYSWVDQGINLDEGMRMIRRAVEQRPDDGYIVDSLGWAYYRINNYDEAVKNLERAVELKPEDPTINDHLGDAYWKVGRFLEASFQWSHARDLGPDPDELTHIEAKLKSGLIDENPAGAEAAKRKAGDGG
ncbi:MAG TPA: tetratricopeptide repeat protein [Xanthobacteraceae bacterium]|nr:tetratricopeptide repeat protein [Xanthobacteraceae bacterium]